MDMWRKAATRSNFTRLQWHTDIKHHQKESKRNIDYYGFIFVSQIIPDHASICGPWVYFVWSGVWCSSGATPFLPQRTIQNTQNWLWKEKNHRIFNSTIVASFHADVMCFTMIHLNRGPPVETILFSNPLPSLFPSETNIFNGKRRATTTAPHGGSRGAGDRARSLPLASRASWTSRQACDSNFPRSPSSSPDGDWE